MNGRGGARRRQGVRRTKPRRASEPREKAQHVSGSDAHLAVGGRRAARPRLLGGPPARLHGLDVGDRRRPVEKLRRGERLKRWHVSAANSIRDARCRTVGAGAGGGGGRVGKAFGKGRYRHNALERSGPPRRRGRRTQPTTSKLHVPLVQARCRLRARPRPRACALT
jgi:hypothetical protein